jgi:hypothetical protein
MQGLLPRWARLGSGGFCLAVGLLASMAHAAPAVRILRVEPRVTESGGQPIVTTLFELSELRRISDVVAPCAKQGPIDARFDCEARALEAPFALYQPQPFPESNAFFLTRSDGRDWPGQFVSQASWGESQHLPRVGTAWLILLDTDGRMGPALRDAKTVAEAWVANLAPSDLVDVMAYNERQVVADSKWVSVAGRSDAQKVLAQAVGQRATGRNRSLFAILKTAMNDAFRALSRVGDRGLVRPLHQAVVVLSTGYGGLDAASTGPGAMQLQQYLTDGHFGDPGDTAQKSPVPVISVFFPHRTEPLFEMNSHDFMSNLANPEVGGLFTIMRPGQGARANRLIDAVRARFSHMQLVDWRVPILAPGPLQSFGLVFTNAHPPVVGESSFQTVLLGFQASTWPLDVSLDATRRVAESRPVRLGQDLTILGDFCWGDDPKRARVYFLPAGEKEPLAQAIAGETLRVSSRHAVVRVPQQRSLVHQSSGRAVIRAIVTDTLLHNTSGFGPGRILELPAVP